MLNPFSEEFEALICHEEFMEKVRDKYHFDLNQKKGLLDVAKKMQECIHKDNCNGNAGWADSLEKEGLSDGKNYYDKMLVCITLGQEVDWLQDWYTQQQDLMSSYMVEAIAGELLLQGYPRWNKLVYKRTARNVRRYHFFGSSEAFPMKEIPDSLARLDIPVRCNEAFCMMPKKSVIFVAEMAKSEENAECEGLCLGCSSKNCPNKMEASVHNKNAGRIPDLSYSYGLQRIFGEA